MRHNNDKNICMIDKINIFNSLSGEIKDHTIYRINDSGTSIIADVTNITYEKNVNYVTRINF